jgi:hypothetical protein
VSKSHVEWFKSSYSQQGGDCIEVAFLTPDTISVRDSTNPTGPALFFAPPEWDAFTTVVRSGTLD